MLSTICDMGKILVKDIIIYAYHGCYKEERQIGSDYKVDVWVDGNFSNAEKSDDLHDTVDYVRISDIVSEEMLIPSKLIEHVAERILSKIMSEFSEVQATGIMVKKMNPPMNTYAESVQYHLQKNR